MTVSDAESVLIALARLEGKVDATLATQGAHLAEHGRRLDDHEPRLRAVEQRPAVTPRAMWTGLAAVAAVVAAITPLLDRLYQ